MPSSIPFTPSPQVVQWRKESVARVNKHLRNKFSGLWRARHDGCCFISDDAEGRLMLMLLLRVRTTAESVMETAPWLTETELAALRKASRKIPWNEIGALLKLTNAERVRHKIWIWPPVDMTAAEVRTWQGQRNTKKNRERQRKKRAKQKEARDMLSNSNDRKDAILMMLAGADAPPPRRGCRPLPQARSPSGDGWTAVPALVERAKTIAAFGGPYQLSVKHRSLRPLVHRTLRRLQEQGEIEIAMGVGTRGPVAFARLRGGNRDAFCHRNSVTGTDEAENADLSMASTEKPASEALSRSPKGGTDASVTLPTTHKRSVH